MKTNLEQTKKRPISPGNKIGNRFPKGVSGNPNGRPTGSRNVSTVLREMLGQIAPSEVIDSKLIKSFCIGKTKITLSDAIATRLIKMALIDGELAAIKEILDRVEGRAKQSFDIDLAVSDWRRMAEQAGVKEEDVFAEARKLLDESDIYSSD